MPSRASKRKRRPSPPSPPTETPTGPTNTDPSSNADPHVAPQHTYFKADSLTRGITINSVAPADLPNRGTGLVTTSPIPAGTRILQIPSKAIFRPDISMLRCENLLTTASPQAQLALSAFFAFMPVDSEYHVWRDTWPMQGEVEKSMPMCWAEEEKALLPEEARKVLERQLGDFERDWECVKGVILREGGHPEQAWRVWRWVWLVVNSRSFHWKVSNGKQRKGGAVRGNEKGMMVLCPFVDYINHGPTGSGCLVTQGPDGYEVVADRDYAPGEEILATYGAHTTTTLLVHYGFVPRLSPTAPYFSPDDILSLDHLLLPHLPSSLHPHLLSLGYLGNYTLHPATNEICFKTQVAVRASIMTSNEWEYFALNGEDLGNDRTEDVEEVVRGLLRGWRRVVEGRVEECETRLQGLGEWDGRRLAVEMVGERWRQILKAVDGYVGHGAE